MASLITTAILLLLASPVLLSILPLPQLYHHYLGFAPDASVAGKRVVVTGASYGIGAELALRYAEYGAHVAIVARTRSKLEKVKERAGEGTIGSIHVVPADLGSLDGCKGALEAALALPEFDGKIDVLVLNHVLGSWSWWLDDKDLDGGTSATSLSEPGASAGGFPRLDLLFQVNALSYIRLATLAIAPLSRGGSVSAAGGGTSRIVVVSSAA